METATHATIYLNDLNFLEDTLKNILPKGNFKRIEQGTVLLYEDKQVELSIEPYTGSFYLSGRIKTSISNCQELINEIVNTFKRREIKFSLDYQEENENGIATTKEFNISNKMDLI